MFDESLVKEGDQKMIERLDARGFSCPQPVVLTRKKMKQMGEGAFEVIVETGTSRDNISRLAKNEGWDIKVSEQGNEFLLTLKK